MRFFYHILVMFFLVSCQSETNACIALAEKGCQFAKEKAKLDNTPFEMVEAACNEAKQRAQNADEAMQSLCKEDTATARRTIGKQSTK